MTNTKNLWHIGAVTISRLQRERVPVKPVKITVKGRIKPVRPAVKYTDEPTKTRYELCRSLILARLGDNKSPTRMELIAIRKEVIAEAETYYGYKAARSTTYDVCVDLGLDAKMRPPRMSEEGPVPKTNADMLESRIRVLEQAVKVLGKMLGTIADKLDLPYTR